MNKLIKSIGILTIIAFVITSCNTQPSLQKYYVDSNENANFVSFDIPASVLSLTNEDASEDAKETLKSIKKVNFLGFQLKGDNQSEYKIEKEKIRKILKNPKYQDLLTVNHGKQGFSIKFLGEEDAIDEVIVFGSDKEKGFALMRVLGNNMNPSKMMALAKEIEYGGDKGDLKQLESFFKNFK